MGTKLASLFTVTDDGWNKDIPMGMDRHDAREYYLDLWGTFKSKIEKPTIQNYNDKYILFITDNYSHSRYLRDINIFIKNNNNY